MLHANDWLDQAHRSLRAGDAVRAIGEHALACFHAQQAAEMALKAVLESHGRDHFGHEILSLLERLSDVGDIEPLRQVARHLSRLYIPTRYPDAAGGNPGRLYGPEDSERALGDARSLMTVARNWMTDETETDA